MSRFGHVAGNQVLRRTVDRIRERLRVSDAVCRYGVEEFELLLQGIDEHAGARLIERVRKALYEAKRGGRNQLRVA